MKLLPVVCESCNDFKITREALEEAYQKAVESNINVKGLLITNPSNPLGTILDRDTLQSLVDFINEKNIHLICDEIYAATVFTKPMYVSIAEILEEDKKCNRDLIHLVYSLSKDMGFPGFRIGIIYSYNDSVVNTARKMSSFGLVSTQTQRLIANMLSDDNFIDQYVSESRKRLAARHGVFTRGLMQVRVGNLQGNAGLFFWMDLRRLLKDSTVDAEMELWRVIINEVKLNVSPGSSFHCSEPGWFRVCYANMDNETMRIALRRIKKFVLQADERQVTAKKQTWHKDLKLSLSFRRCDDTILMTPRMVTPHMMSPHVVVSPHSPLASPLVRARN